MNVELLRAIKAQILADPEAFRMDTWSCGTAHCIAGWALVLSGMPIVNPKEATRRQRLTDGREPSPVAAELLGIAPPSADGWDYSASDRLFDAGNWPVQFCSRFYGEESQPTRGERAQIAAERIDHFIATDGAE